MSDLPPELVATQWERPTVPSGVGPGWWPLLVEAHSRLSDVDPQ